MKNNVKTYAAVMAKIPLGGQGQPEKVAAMIAWLGSDELFLLDRRHV